MSVPNGLSASAHTRGQGLGILLSGNFSGRENLGVFWSTTKTRDHRRFPGAAEKTLPRQSLEYISAKGNGALLNVEEEEVDPLLWPRVRPPDIDPS